MAEVRLADVIEPDVWQEYLSLRTTELSEIVQSGIATSDPRFSALLAGAGTLFQMPFFNDLADTEAVIGSDNPAVDIVPDKIGTGQDNAVRHFRNKAWSSTDILPSIIGPDPMGEIVSKIAEFWTRQDQRSLISSIEGVLADNIANDASDMVSDIYTDALGGITAANRISGTAALDTMQTMGDQSAGLVAMIMHSAVMTELRKQNLITDIPNARGEVMFSAYMGKRIVVDDTSKTVAGTNNTRYTTLFFGPGAFGFAEGSPKNPVAVEREELKANGSGLETLVSRREMLLHPRGISFVPGAVVGFSPTNAELEAATQWTRVYDRKLIRMAALYSNV